MLNKVNYVIIIRRIYLVRARPAMVKYIADQINAERSSDCRRSYKILLVPRKVCD